jgi:hypothetical protein
MAYTAAYFAEVEAALAALVRGERIVRVKRNGQTVEYGQANVMALEEHRDNVAAEIAAAERAASTSVRRRFFLTSSDKGL